MPNFKAIDSLDNINLSKGWADSTKFNSKGRIVGKNGKPVTAAYKGSQYCLIAKKERAFSTAERVGRGFLGAVSVVFSLGFVLLSKSVRNLFTQEKTKVRFAVVIPSSENNREKKITDEKVDERTLSEKELQSGVTISDDTISKIQRSMKNILQVKEEEGVKFYTSQGIHRVFSLESASEYIFKMKAVDNLRDDNSMSARYQKMVEAQTVCRTHKLGLLVIPNAKLFTVEADGKKYEIIAEKKLDFNPKESAQEKLFEEYASTLNETIRQLALFICKTGYSDVEWRNNPILNDSLNEWGQRKFALIDLEEMGDTRTGLFGTETLRRGLVRCINEEQGKIVEKVAKENGASTSSFANARTRRKEELEKVVKLKKFYDTHNIVTGYEPLQVDTAALGLDLAEKKTIEERDWDAPRENGRTVYRHREVTLEEVAEHVIKKINRAIQKKAENESPKGKRHLRLNTNKGSFRKYDNLGTPTNGCFIDQKDTWLYRIINALVEKGHLFELEKVNGHGYFIQA